MRSSENRWSFKQYIFPILFLLIVNIFFFRGPIFQSRLSGVIIGGARDTLLNSYILEHGYNKLLQLEFKNFFQTNILYPARNALTFSEHLLGHQLLYFPIRSITRHPLVSYNILLILNYFLCSVGVYALGLFLFKDKLPALFLSIAFTYSSVLIQQVGHFQICSLPWIGFLFLALFRYLDTGNLKDGLPLLIFWLMESLGSYYIGYMVSLAMLCVTATHLFVNKRYLDLRLWKSLSVIGGCYLLAMFAVSLPYLESSHYYDFRRSLGENILGSAILPFSFFLPSSFNALLGRVHRLNDLFHISHIHEKTLFMGILGSLLFLYGLYQYHIKKWRPDNPIYYKHALMLAIIFSVLSLGPIISTVVICIKGELSQGMGELTWGFLPVPLPYLVFYYLFPGFSSMRTPARFGIIFMLAGLVIATYGFVCIRNRVRFSRARGLFSGLILIFLVVELCPVLPFSKVEPVPEAIRAIEEIGRGTGAWAYYPTGYRRSQAYYDWTLTARYIYYSSYHSKEVINGFSGFECPSNERAKRFLKYLDEEGHLDRLREMGISHIVVFPGAMTPEEEKRINRLLWRQSLAKIRTFKDGSYICMIKKPPEERIASLSKVFRLGIADGGYLLGMLSFGNRAEYVSGSRDLFENVSIDIIGPDNRILHRFKARFLFPAVVEREHDILFRIKIPEGLHTEKVARAVVKFHKRHEQVLVTGDDILRVASLHRPLSREEIEGIKLVCETDILGPFQAGGHIEALKVRIINGGEILLPALGVFVKEEHLLTEPLARLGIREAEKVGDFRIGLSTKWWNPTTGGEVVAPKIVTWLPHNIGPKSKVPLSVLTRTPKNPGSYILEVGIIQGPRRWLGDRGMETLKIPVRVR